MPAPFTYLDLGHPKIFLPPSLLVVASLRLPAKDAIFFILPCMYLKYSLCVRAHFVCILSHTWGRCLPACIHVCARVYVGGVCVCACMQARLCMLQYLYIRTWLCKFSINSVCMAECVCVCVCVCCMHWILKICTVKECAYGLCGLGALSTHFDLYVSL